MGQTIVQRSWLERLWTGIADQGRAFARVPPTDLAGAERVRQLADALLSEKGEASGATLAHEIVAALRDLPEEERQGAYRLLGASYAPDPARLHAAAEAYLLAPDNETAAALHRASEPPRQELLRRMNMAPGGTATLVAMRRDILPHVHEDAALRALDHDLLHLFISWFNRGFLELRRIGWETSAAVLEKLLRYEAVHEIAGWTDLRRRLLPDRRCFAFFHQALPNEPLIFVEVALTRGLACAIQPLLSPPDTPEAPPPEGADTAIFYSISNCQDGLRGVSFGNFLIKQVVEELQAELPGIAHFATLSPAPGFRAWLLQALRSGEAALTGEETAALARCAGAAADNAALIAQATAESWWLDPQRREALRAPLLRLAARYLLRPPAQTGIDPVARFHLGNGARLENLNFLANTAPRGIAESYGIMANYLYDPASIAANHEKFVRAGSIARSPAIDAMAQRQLHKAPAG